MSYLAGKNKLIMQGTFAQCFYDSGYLVSIKEASLRTSHQRVSCLLVFRPLQSYNPLGKWTLESYLG